MDIFKKLNISESPILLAPLAGVSDHPFRRICQRNGADITYVEMISATALLYESQRTLSMLKRHSDENILGVQVTGRSAEDVGQAVALLDQMPFDTIDINMGCPVRKVVKTGCGSAILKDPERVRRTVQLAREATGKPLSAKIRIGWDRNQVNGVEVAQAIAESGADWIVVHGRTRADDYGCPVDLEQIGRIKKAVSIPVIGNGNIFSSSDAKHMMALSDVDGVMVSRGALGNPWVFSEIKGTFEDLHCQDWLQTISDHLLWQLEEYGDSGAGAVCMRKHLLWYAKGWPGVKTLRDKVNGAESLLGAKKIIEEFVEGLEKQSCFYRRPVYQLDQEDRFAWDPKWEMDRKLDRGIGDDGLENFLQS